MHLLLKLEDILAKYPVASGLVTGSAAANLSLQNYLSHNQDLGQNPLRDVLNFIFHVGTPAAIGALTYYAGRRAKDADRDALTGVFSRRWYEKNIGKIANKAEKGNYSIGLHYFDLNKLKPINDTYGHHRGDSLLENFGRILIRSTRPSDYVARLGGDEFLVIIINPNYKPDEILRRVTENTIKFNEKNSPDIKDPLSFAWGYDEWMPREGTDIKHAIKSAEEEMYTNKKVHNGQIN